MRYKIRVQLTNQFYVFQLIKIQKKKKCLFVCVCVVKLFSRIKYTRCARNSFLFPAYKINTLPVQLITMITANKTYALYAFCPTVYKMKIISLNYSLSQFFLFIKGLKRSVTTLRGGSLGYAEIVAVKVFLLYINKCLFFVNWEFFPLYYLTYIR